MKVIDINKIEVRTVNVRRYRKSFFAYGKAIYEDKTFDCGDPQPNSTVFPRHEGVMEVLMNIEGEKQISEKDFRQLFKGVKNGKNLYAEFSDFLEKRHKVEFTN